MAFIFMMVSFSALAENPLMPEFKPVPPDPDQRSEHADIRNKNFHVAETETEKDFDKLIHESAPLFDFQHPENDYDLPLTDDLYQAIYETNDSIKKDECDGSEDLGVTCGLDYNPIICDTDLADIYFYKTEAEDDLSATLFSSTDEAGENPNKYRLIRQSTKWKIDSISCAGRDKFN